MLVVVASVSGLVFGLTSGASASSTSTVSTATTASSSLVWQSPVPIDSLANPPTDHPITGISCPTTTFCAMVDSAGYALTYNGKSWTTPTLVLVSPYSSEPGDTGSFSAVSCPSSTFCVAGGVEPTSANPVSVYSIYNGTSWSAPVALDATTTQTGSSDPGMLSVSCPTTTFCMAGFLDGAYATYNGTSWTMDSTGLPFIYYSSTTYVDGPVASLSCLSATFCAASSYIIMASTNEHELLTATWDGTGWTSGYDGGQVTGATSISCGSPSSCVVVQGVGGNSDQPAVTYNGSTWTTASTADDTANVVEAVSCPTASSCTGVDSGGNAVTYNGTSWGTPMPVFSAGTAQAISCPTTSFCVAGTSDGAAS
ncbi:MAG: hypothetical protein ACYCV5_12050, partial [Acidimicrobiales bacterium]